MNSGQNKAFVYIQKQYEIQVKIYEQFMEGVAGQSHNYAYNKGFIEGYFSGSIIQLELLAEKYKLVNMAGELKALYSEHNG